MINSLPSKYRQLLFFGHSGSNEIRTLKFAFDGSQIEDCGLTLGDLTLRGMVFAKESGSSENFKFFVLDSEGYLHHFLYSGPDSSIPILPKFKKVLSMKEFLQNRKFLNEKLTSKKRSRGKSQNQKRNSRNSQKKKRSKSLMRRVLSPEEMNILYDLFLLDY